MLSGNGWSSFNNHPLFNIMCVSRAGKEFLETIDTLEHTKDVVYIANVMKRYLTEVGFENVVQICTNNASMMHKAICIIQEDWPHLYFQRCMAYALNFLLQDWGSPLWASSVVEDAQKLIKFIKLYHVPLVLFQQHAAIHV